MTPAADEAKNAKPVVFVTGIAGFIGFHLACRLMAEGHPVVGIDNLNDYYDVELKVWDEIRDKLKEVDIASLTPMEALNILRYLKSKSDKFQ